MQILMDNLDGAGPLDYTAAVVAAGPVTVTRERGEWATCEATLDVAGAGLAVPVAGARVVVRNAAGVVLFSGYAMRAPQAVAGGAAGGTALVRFEAAEDAWLAGVKPDASLQPATSAVHALVLDEDAVELHALPAADLPRLAGDVTVSGAHEATAYVTELFDGDGTTEAFALMDAPFRESGNATLLLDSFEGPQFAAQTWTTQDTGQHLGFGSGGLLVTGGNGLDGQTTLVAVEPVEMGGTLVAELAGVTLAAGSDGVLLGLYSNIVTIPNCVAGFRVKGTAGATTMVALVNGQESGTAFTWDPTHTYTLRLRVHCPEMQRVLGSYEALVNGAVQQFGGGLVSAPLSVVLEVQDLGLASNTVATVLYAGAMASGPARCVLGVLNSVDLLVTAARCTLRQAGSAWVTSTLPGGGTLVRREGTADEGADFALSGASLHFWPGRVPAAGETFAVQYRRGARACARVQDAAAVSNAANLGLPGVPAWTGAVKAARSSADCVAAAGALLAFFGSPATGVAGSCVLLNQPVDVQVGDQVALPAAGGGAAVQVPVRRAVLTDGHAVPEVVRVRVEFAQAVSNGLSFAVGNVLAADVPLPVAVSAAGALAGLQGLQVVSATATALQVDAGMTAPNGGGFEVRRRDGGWGGGGADLVLRSPVRSFSVPRAAFAERFFVRMYDGSAPARYSGVSAVVVTHLPVS